MWERGQTTVEYAGLALLVLVVVLGLAAAARASLPSPATGDAAFLPLAERYAPMLLLEQGDGSVPVDFRRCRRPACAGGEATIFVHGVRRNGHVYLQYWSYLPDSRTAHTGVPYLDGEHADDWEGVIVKLREDGTVVGARVSAHLGWSGRHPWWELAKDDWAPYPAPVFRAAGSHAGAFHRDGIDLAGDRWDGDGRRVRARLVPADEARQAGARFGPGSVPPWQKAAWNDPETVVTGRRGDRANYARYARWWALACPVCRGAQ